MRSTATLRLPQALGEETAESGAALTPDSSPEQAAQGTTTP